MLGCVSRHVIINIENHFIIRVRVGVGVRVRGDADKVAGDVVLEGMDEVVSSL